MLDCANLEENHVLCPVGDHLSCLIYKKRNASHYRVRGVFLKKVLFHCYKKQLRAF